jgi:hypothetical protein
MKSFSQWSETNNLMDPEVQADQEVSRLSGQIATLLERMKLMISKMQNKNKGYEILGQIGQSIQDAMPGITDANMRKAVLGQMPGQRQ